MADPIVSVLLEKLVAYLMDEASQLLEFEDQLDEIRIEFECMQDYVRDADRVKRRDRSETLKRTMNHLRELIYDAEEIIGDCRLVCEKQKKQGWASNSFSPTLLKSRYVLGKKLRNVNKRIKQVKQNMISYLATVPVYLKKEENENVPLTHPVLMSDDDVVGLEDESRQIIDALLVQKDYLKVIGIVGMGGIGKTTLAQKICKSNMIETEFQPLSFVTVSQTFRFDELLKKILNKAGGVEGSLHDKGVDDLLNMLKDKLDGRKYLIVLDDVWGVEKGQWWYSLDSALPRGKGGCVMVTTRNEGVARSMGTTDEHIYHAEILSDKNSWLLFCKVAFARTGGISPNAELEKCGKKIVAQCRGLPLTIRVCGGMMLAKGDSVIQWERIAKNLKEETASSNIVDELVNSKLELSYEELHINIRACLLYLAVFPEDYEPNSFQIIQMWIAEGLVWKRRGISAFQMGEEYLNEICNRCLISKEEEQQFGNGIAFHKMHDAIREMLIKIGKEDGFFSMNEANKLSRRVVMYENVPPESNLASQLRVLVMIDTKSEAAAQILEENLKRLQRLRTLHVELDNIVKSAKWVNRIVSLHHLVYLLLHNIHALTTLPNSIGDLCNLQILTITSCYNLESLPSSITKLEKLIVLNVKTCEKLEHLPKGLGKLSNLEQLICVRSESLDVINKWLSFSDLKDLKKLRLIKMEISVGEQISEEECTVLQMPESLQILGFEFPGVTPTSEVEIARKIDHPLCHPLEYLKELYFEFYPGENTPIWISPTFLPNLCYLYIYGGKIKNMGSRFFEEGARWKVETLVLGSLEEFEDDWTMIERAMPFLRHAHVKNCPKLKYSLETFQLGRHGWITWRKIIRGDENRGD